MVSNNIQVNKNKIAVLDGVAQIGEEAYRQERQRLKLLLTRLDRLTTYMVGTLGLAVGVLPFESGIKLGVGLLLLDVIWLLMLLYYAARGQRENRTPSFPVGIDVLNGILDQYDEFPDDLTMKKISVKYYSDYTKERREANERLAVQIRNVYRGYTVAVIGLILCLALKLVYQMLCQ